MTGTQAVGASTIQRIAIAAIVPSPFNPRKQFDGIDELAESIKTMGLLENLVVRPGKKAGQFELVAGERRWRACKKAELAEVDCKVITADDGMARAATIVENLQRADIKPLEEAQAFADLQDTDPKKWTAGEIARVVGMGKTPRFVQQRLALARNLVPEHKARLLKGDLAVETARVLAMFPAAAQQAVPTWTLDRETNWVRRELFSQCIPESAAKFDIALYKGEWLTNGEGAKAKRFFADTAAFLKLQKGAAEKKLEEVRKDWPKAELVEANDARHKYWPDASSRWSIDEATAQRAGDVPRAFKVPKDKCVAIVWIAPNGEIRKALGVCSKPAIEAAFDRKTSTSRSSGGGYPRSSQRGEKPAHRKARTAFNKAITVALAKKADVVARWFLFNLMAGDDMTSPLAPNEVTKRVPAPLKPFKFAYNTPDETKAKLWVAITKLPIATVKSTIDKLCEVDPPQWSQWGWDSKPAVMVAVAQTLGVAVPEIALPEPPKKPEPKAKPKAKAKKAAKAKKHQ